MTKWTVNELAYAKGTSEPVRRALLAMHEKLNALEQQAEPVAWMDRDGDLYRMPVIENWSPPHTLLYAAPPQRKPLTEEKIKEAVLDDPIGGAVLLGLMRDEVMVTQLRQAINLIARATEAAHGIKEKS